MRLYYIRHGQPIYEPDSLTELGEAQARALAKRLSVIGIDRIFSSTSNRAYQTAKATSEQTGKEITQLEFTHEKYAAQEFVFENEKGERVWAFFSQNAREIFADKALAFNEKWYEDNRFSQYSFKMGVERVNANVDEWLLSLGYRHNRQRRVYEVVNSTQENVALFAHGGFGEIFMSSVLDIPYPLFCNHFDYLGHSQVTVIDFAEHNGIVIPKVLTYSNDGHLYGEEVNITK